MRPSIRRVVAISCCITLLLSVTGCAVINPYVSARDSEVAQDPSLPNAVAYAEATRDEYECAVSQYTWMNRTVGVTLIGVAAAAAALGIIGGSSDVITGLGVGGAGLFGIDRLLYREARLRAYTEGAKAVGCTLAAFAPVRVADPNELEAPLVALSAELSTLEGLLKGAPEDIARSTEVIRGNQVLKAGKDTLARGRATFAALAAAGIRLYESIEGIRAEVNKALLSSEPDIQELVQGLSQFIPTNAALIAPPAAAPPPAKASSLSGFETERRDLREAANAVEATRAEVETILARIGNEPTQDQLAACMFDPVASGVMFRVDPTGVTITAGQGTSTGVIIASGGKGPYHAAWVGTPPGTGVTLEPVNHDAGGPNQATVTVKVETTAAAGAYSLLVTDEGAGRATVPVIVDKGRNAGSGGGATTKVTPPNNQLEKAQLVLIELKCLPAKNAKGGSNADGQWGNATAAAIDNLSVAIGNSPEELKQTIGTWGEEKFIEKLNQVLAQAKDQGKLCTPPATPAPQNL